MTLRQRKLAKALTDPTTKTLADAKRKAGYSEQSRWVYNPLTKLAIQKSLATLGIDRKAMNERFKLLADLALKDKDYANTNRSYENICKIQRFFDSGSVGDVDARQFTINFINQPPLPAQPVQPIDIKPSNKPNK